MGGVAPATARDAASAVRRLAFEQMLTAVDREFDALVGSEVVGTQVGGTGTLEASMQATSRMVEAATQAAGAGTTETGTQAATMAADVGTQATGATSPSPPAPSHAHRRRTQAATTWFCPAGHGAAAGGSASGGGRYDSSGQGRLSSRRTTFWACERGRGLHAAHERCLARGWDWGVLDDGALA